jgi:hypothetical protein
MNNSFRCFYLISFKRVCPVSVERLVQWVKKKKLASPIMLLLIVNLTICVDVDSNTFDSLLNEEWATDFAPNVTNAYKRKDYKDLSIAKLNQLLESWINKRENMTHGFESVFGKARIT